MTAITSRASGDAKYTPLFWPLHMAKVRNISVYIYKFIYISVGPYDGIGGCLKRTTARASLSRTYKDQIIYPYQVYQFCRDNITGVTVLWCGEDHIDQLWRQKLEERYGRAKTVPGTQKYHFFSPIAGTTKVNAKLLSCDHVSDTHKTCSA